ncbi:hypothetical protein [Pacificibacter marinus]|uniref:Transglycosylase SLT domain-containing protein n=1 Tax=Pacificibacter marinus TaxID=658057 RepID=A0A1Y5RFX6_9RHOB|nr:hypothetical protein [Pacificibacter marinus]SEK21188.1 hypothetical protein SAMN04488032_101310 [Pacificibacter marinus]SLN16383.1 hypothetical protein PAM7971_00340 [Pacificibacter marinus]
MFTKTAALAVSTILAFNTLQAQADQPAFQLDYDALIYVSNTAFSVSGNDGRYQIASFVTGEYTATTRTIAPLFGDTATQKLKSLIARAEAPHLGYDAVVKSAWRKPNDAPSQMRISEIYDWIGATPNQNHAIGRYQFIPTTLKRLVAKAGLHHDVPFNADTQDMLADLLLEEAGYTKFLSGQMPRHRFMNRLARIWAGLPTSNGRSYYHGHAGNRATISWAHYDDAMQMIFVASGSRTPAATPLPF